MKTNRLLVGLASAAMLGLTSCPETTVPREFGAKPLKLKAEDWNGVWSAAGENEGMTFAVTNAAKGELTVTFPEKEKGKEQDPPMNAVVREITRGDESKDLAFLIHFDKESTDFGPFNLMRCPEKGVFYLWSPKHDVIEAAVKSGELKGDLKRVEKTKDEEAHDHTLLVADPANYPKLLDPKFWDWTKPEAFVRSSAK
jgi:hypothetical protein